MALILQVLSINISSQYKNITFYCNRQKNIILSFYLMPQNKVIEAPVVLFIYKRPDHALKIIEKINQAKIKKVYIIADGWKNEIDRPEVEQTRNLVTKIKTVVEKIFFDKNIGLRKNAEIGLKKVFNFEEKAIILEDLSLIHI